MRRETTAFLDLVREAEAPTTLDEERVRRALRAAIAAAEVPSASSGEILGVELLQVLYGEVIEVPDAY